MGSKRGGFFMKIFNKDLKNMTRKTWVKRFIDFMTVPHKEF